MTLQYPCHLAGKGESITTDSEVEIGSGLDIAGRSAGIGRHIDIVTQAAAHQMQR